MAEKKSIYAKLVDVRTEFHASSIKKTGYNDYSNYYYFELSDFLIPATAILKKHDLVAIVSFGLELATMTVIDYVTGESFVITSPLSTANLKACQPVQSMGACETFVRRYLYVSLLEIVEHDVIEEATGKPEKAEKVKPAQQPEQAPGKPMSEPATEAQYAAINDFVAAEQIPPRRLAWLKVEKNWNNMTKSQATTIIAECKEMKK